MSQFYADDNGNRVIVRHKGPPGEGIPTGGTVGQILVKDSSTDYDTHWANPPDGTDAVVGPVSAVNNRIATFDGITGKLIKDSGTLVADLATTSLVSTKEDKVAGKGLSTNDFTTPLKEKLEALNEGGFRGVFPSISAINAFSFVPAATPGDYCYIEVADETLIEVLWDSTNFSWTEQVLEPVLMTGAEIATALFNDDDALLYDQPDCRIYTSTEKAQLAAHEVVISGLAGTVSGLQPQDATLTAFAGLANTVDKIAYFNGVDSMAVVDFTGVARALVAATTLAGQRNVLELGTTDNVTFNSVKTAAPAAGTAKPVKFGAVTAITDAAMLALGFTSQQQIDVDGTVYYVPIKTSAWA